MLLTFLQSDLYQDQAYQTGEGIGMILICLFFFVVVVVAIGLYFLPGIIASLRKHPQSMGIWIVNILAGWTMLGWVAALIWSFVDPQRPQPVYYVQPQPQPCTVIKDGSSNL